MRLLSFDPGGEKLGWSVLDSGLQGPEIYRDSGVFKWPRSGQPYQEYRMKLTRLCRGAVLSLIATYLWHHDSSVMHDSRVVTEIVPAIGSEGFMKSGQGYIANIVATTIHNCAFERGHQVVQVPARTWETRIALRKTRSERVTKPKIRNGVLVHLPELRKELAPHLMEWDRWDALGMGLFILGYQTV